MTTEFGKITCDLEGKILEFNNTSEKMFECQSIEVVNTKRIFYFFSEINILKNINEWMNLSQINETNIYTILKTKNNKYFSAHININPSKNNNTILFIIKIYKKSKKNLNINQYIKKQNILQKIKNFAHIIRLHFLLGTIIPITFAAIAHSIKNITTISLVLFHSKRQPTHL